MFLIVGALCEDEDEDTMEDLKSRAHRIVHFPNGTTEIWLDDLCRVVVLPDDSKSLKARMIKLPKSLKAARMMELPIPGASLPGGRYGGSAAGTVAASATASDEWRF